MYINNLCKPTDVPWTKLTVEKCKWSFEFSSLDRERKEIPKYDLATGYLECKSIITRLFSNHRPLLRYYYTLDILSPIGFRSLRQELFAREKNGRRRGEGVVIDGRRWRWSVSCEPLSRRTFRMRRRERERERFLSRAFIGTGALVKPKNGTTAIEMLRKLHGS